MKFNLLDAFILAIIAFGLWRGYVAGFIREFSQLLGVFLAFAIGLQVMNPLGVALVQVMNVLEMPLEAMALLAFVLVFLTVYLIVWLLARILDRAADAAKLGAVNKLFGSIAGAAKTALVLSVLMVFFGQVGVPSPETEKSSYLYTPVEKIAPNAWTAVSRSMPTVKTTTHIPGERFWKKPEGDQEHQPPDPSLHPLPND